MNGGLKMADEYIDKVEVGAKIQMMYIRCEMDYGGENDFCRGMRKALRIIENMPAADVKPAKQWISVKDRQPQENGFYLTYYSKQIHVSQWFISANWYNEHGGNVTNNVEYWQPLPEPPQD